MPARHTSMRPHPGLPRHEGGGAKDQGRQARLRRRGRALREMGFVSCWPLNAAATWELLVCRLIMERILDVIANRSHFPRTAGSRDASSRWIPIPWDDRTYSSISSHPCWRRDRSVQFEQDACVPWQAIKSEPQSGFLAALAVLTVQESFPIKIHVGLNDHRGV